MKTPFDTLEERLSSLRPSPLPTSTRRRIVHEMEPLTTGTRSVSWLFGHHAGLQVALAGALSLALLAGWNWLPRPSHSSRGDGTADLTASVALLPGLAWGTELAAGENTVAVLRSPSMLTNLQIRR
jgi:hypothetical protein